MKRSKPLSRGPSHDAKGRVRFSSFDGPRTPLTRSPMARKAPKRLKRRAEHAPFLAFVRTQACCSCHVEGPSEAAHMTLNRDQKGMSMKVPDSQAVPLCREHHRDWDQRKGRYAGKSDDYRYSLGALWVQATRALWQCHQLETTGAPGTGEVIS